MAKTAATSATDRADPTRSAAPADNVLTALLAKARPLVMGVLNVTPDSFSDGGRFFEPPAAIEHARRLAADGADIIDIGAESTRPYGGMRPISAEEERGRLEPILDIIAEVTNFFSRSLEIAWAAGIGHNQIVLDPGIGFGKTSEQSITCLARLDAWRGFDLPLLVGASRKRFIHSITPSPTQRLGGSIAAHLAAVEHGAAIIRTHDVAPTLQSFAVAAAIRRAR